MVSKIEFFKGLDRSKKYHPTKTLPRSNIVVVTPETSTASIDTLLPHQVAILPYSLVPYGYREGPEAKDHFSMFLKRGPTVAIPTPSSLEDALRDGHGPTTRRLSVYNSLDDYILAAGISWYCPQDRMHRKVSCHDVLEGMQIYAFSEQERSTAQPNKKNLIHVHEYGIDAENKDGGASVVVSVPSRSQDRSYRVKLHHFPFVGSHDVWVWMQLESEHSDCGSKDFGDVYWQRGEDGKRRKLRDVVFCPHDVAAYLAVSRQETERIRRTYAQPRRVIPIQPFPLFTQKTVHFWNKLVSQTFFGSPHSARSLREHEIELELQRFLAREKPIKETMYVSGRDKITQYDWSGHFPLSS